MLYKHHKTIGWLDAFNHYRNELFGIAAFLLLFRHGQNFVTAIFPGAIKLLKRQ